MNTPVTSTNTSSDGAKFTGPIIDTDIHETFSSWHDLVPYLKELWRGLIINGS